MMTIEVNGEFSQVEIWDHETSDFSDWIGDKGQPFTRTDTAIQISIYLPYYDSSVILNVLSNEETDKLDPKKVKIFSGNIAVPSGKLNIGDLFIKTYLQFKVESLVATLTIYVDEAVHATQIDIVLEGDISSGIEFGG